MCQILGQGPHSRGHVSPGGGHCHCPHFAERIPNLRKVKKQRPGQMQLLTPASAPPRPRVFLSTSYLFSLKGLKERAAPGQICTQ